MWVGDFPKHSTKLVAPDILYIGGETAGNTTQSDAYCFKLQFMSGLAQHGYETDNSRVKLLMYIIIVNAERRILDQQDVVLLTMCIGNLIAQLSDLTYHDL